MLGKRSTERKFYPNVWDIIGGHREHNETAEQILFRELQEEIGITPTKFNHVTLLYKPSHHPGRRYELHICRVTDWTGKPENLLPSEHSELAWFKIREACELHLAHPSYPALFQGLADV